MENNIMISGMAVYHPDTLVKNDFYLDNFQKQGRDVSKLLIDVFGRKSRYEISNKGKEQKEYENSLTMEITAAKKVLEVCNMKGNDVDAVILTGQILEYTVPCSAAFVYKAIGGKQDGFFYDLDANCVGMLMAYQQAVQYMAFNPRLRNVLVVGGDYMTFGIDEKEETLYGAFGDSACAMILSRTQTDSGLIDFDYFMHGLASPSAKLPACGLSNIYKASEEKMKTYQIGKIDCDLDIVSSKIQAMLKKQNLTIDDISVFCFSQYVIKNIEEVRSSLNIPKEKCPYIGDQYGYTGTNSPFLALQSFIDKNGINRGDYIFFWTLAAGMQHIFLLIKY